MSLQTEHLDPAAPPRPVGPRPGNPNPWYPIRRLAERHRERVLTHLLALDAADRHLRFGHVASDEQIAHYVAQIDFERDEVFGVFDSRLRVVAMAHLAFAPGPQDVVAATRTAEFGVSVSERQRGRGIGGRLFDHAVTHARNRGAGSLAIHFARDNAAMQAIVRRAGASVAFEGGDAVGLLPLPADTLGTQLSALLETQAAELDYRWKMQVLRLDRLWPGLLQASSRR
jgi:ribosomal protein S18 acetylase RimI-like enzyme